MASQSSSAYGQSPFEAGNPSLFSLLKRVHSLPYLPASLYGLTFPELLPKPINDTVALLREHRKLTPLFEELIPIYQKASSRQTTRLFTLFSEGSVLLFSIPKRGEELVSIGVYSVLGRESIFEAKEGVEREILERIFGKSPLFDRKEMKVEECSPSAALELWIAPCLEEEESSWGATSESEGVLSRAFQAAHNSGNVIEEISLLEKLARIYLERENYTTAAHLLNGALALSESPRYQRIALDRLEKIEWLVASKRVGKELAFDRSHSLMDHREDLQRIRAETSRLLGEKRPANHHNYLIRHRDELQRIRAEAADLMQRGLEIEKVQARLTRSYEILLSILIDESIAFLGRGGPEGFAVMGLGSMARKEMCPYSDLEFAFLLRDSSSENLDYCRAIDQILTLKMINMGETKYLLSRSKGREDQSLVPTGFSMDIGGICPSGKSGLYELIGTPQQLARFQREEWLRDNDSEIILVNAMTTVCFVMGDEELVTAYKREVAHIFNEASAASSSSQPAPLQPRQRRALRLMQGFVSEFQPKLDEDKINLRAFNVKKELYRLLQTVISGLALYYNLESSNSLEQIDELQEKGMLTSEGASRLKTVLKSVFRLRIESHLFYKTEKEILYNPHKTGIFSYQAISEETEQLLLITPELRREIKEIYRTLIPFHQAAQAFINGNCGAFVDSFFYQEKVKSHSLPHRLALQSDGRDPRHDTVLQSATSRVALNPDSVPARWDLGITQQNLKAARKAVKHYEEALSLLRGKHGNGPHPDLAAALHILGNVYSSVGYHERAFEHFNASFKMLKKVYPYDKGYWRDEEWHRYYNADDDGYEAIEDLERRFWQYGPDLQISWGDERYGYFWSDGKSYYGKETLYDRSVNPHFREANDAVHVHWRAYRMGEEVLNDMSWYQEKQKAKELDRQDQQALSLEATHPPKKKKGGLLEGLAGIGEGLGKGMEAGIKLGSAVAEVSEHHKRITKQFLEAVQLYQQAYRQFTETNGYQQSASSYQNKSGGKRGVEMLIAYQNGIAVRDVAESKPCQIL